MHDDEDEYEGHELQDYIPRSTRRGAGGLAETTKRIHLSLDSVARSIGRPHEI
jgi:hypothetical protein